MTFEVVDMTGTDVDTRIDYFHSLSDEMLDLMGVGREMLPAPAAMRESFAADAALPIDQRQNYSLLWQVDGQTVGFSTTDQVTFGDNARMHLHVLDGANRRQGMGTRFVQLSAQRYFDVLQIHTLYCEPKAINVAPNRTLQAAGFRYLYSYETKPGLINEFQVVTRWELQR